VFEPIKSEKIYKMVMRQVRTLITEGDLSPGDRLPGERELSSLLTVSRASVRQAIAALEAQGIVTKRQGDGTFVVGRGGNADEVIESFSRFLAEEQINPTHILESRLVVECATTRFCAERAADEEINGLKALLERRRIAEGRKDSFAQMNRDLHIAIAQGSKNPALIKVMELLLEMMDLNMWPRLKQMSEEREKRVQKHLDQHEEIVDAIIRRDADGAYESMRNHLETIEREMTQDLSTPISYEI